MKRISVIFGMVIIVCLILILLFWNHTPNISESGGSVANEITATQISQHSNSSDCWAAIGGSVYDLTDYFIKHPDNTLASQLCGQADFSQALPIDLKADTLLKYRLGVLAP